MTTLRLEVGKAYPNDSGRGIARLGMDAFSHLGLTPGDHIEIGGNDTTVAKAWRADRVDWGTETVYIDGFIRQNADVGISEPVEICKLEVAKADSLTLRTFKESPVQFRSDAAGRVKRQLLQRPVVERDIVPVMSNTSNHPSTCSSDQAIPLLAVTTEPNGPVIVIEETAVTIQTEDE
jgi:transitional endoplasmic reticulum ATPase